MTTGGLRGAYRRALVGPSVPTAAMSVTTEGGAREVVSESGGGPLAAAAGEWRLGASRPRLAVGLHGFTLVVGLAALVMASRGHWFVIDEWAFLTDRRVGDVRSLFVPHNEHWSTLPIVLWRGLFAAVGLHSYWPYQLVTLAVHLGVVHLLWRLQRRAGVAPGVAIATSGLFVVFGAGAENILNAFAMTFDAAMLFGLGHVLLVDHDGRFDRRDGLGLGLALAGLLSSGVAVTMVVVAGLTASLRRGWRAGVVTVAPPAALYLVWLVSIGHASLGAVRAWEPERIPAFVWHGLTTTFDVAASMSGVGAVAVAGLGVGLLRHRGELRGRLAATTACALGAVVFFAVIGVGRAMLSLAHAETSRYLYVAGGLLIPAVGAALSDLTSRRRLARAGVVVLVALLAVNGIRLLLSRSAYELAIEGDQRRLLLAAARLDLPQSELDTMPEPVLLAPHLAYSELWEMQQKGKLPSGEDVSRDWELLALTILKVSTSRAPLLPLGPHGGGPVAMGPGPQPEAPAGLGPQPQVPGGLGAGAGPGCLPFEPKAEPSQIVLRVTVPVTLPLHTTADSVGVFLRDEDGTTSRIGFLVRLFHTSTYLNLHLYEREVVLTLPADAFVTLCGLGGW